MKQGNKAAEKTHATSNVLSAIKKLKKIRNQIAILDMRSHVRTIDKNISDLIKLRRELEKKNE